MDFNRPDNYRNIFGISILNATISGMLLGSGAFFLKIAMLDFFSPFLWVAIFLSILGFALMQKALHKCSVSIVIPTITGTVIITSVILAFLFLSESVSYSKLFGIVLILIGTFGLIR